MYIFQCYLEFLKTFCACKRKKVNLG
uniref:Uncharacterized protein n=1 Tax=Rhizophora mucronata TaxID=61149 RepID=A0A2P2QVJ8_RHIMU